MKKIALLNATTNVFQINLNLLLPHPIPSQRDRVEVNKNFQ